MGRTTTTPKRATYFRGRGAKRTRTSYRDASYEASSEDEESHISIEAPKEVCSRCDERNSHSEITSYLTIGSDILKVFAGTDPDSQAIAVHRDLLAFHSNNFKDGRFIVKTIVKIQSEQIDSVFDSKDVTLQDVTPLALMQFHSWMQHGSISAAQRALARHSTPANGFEGLWVLGEKLSSAGFQNFALDELRARARVGTWPTVEQARYVYVQTVAGSKLREFVAATLVVNSPFRGEDGKDAWLKLFAECPDMNDAFLVASGREWQGGSDGDGRGQRPWDGECRAAFAIEEQSVRERWLAMINERSKAVIEEAAGRGCLRSQLELAIIEADG